MNSPREQTGNPTREDRVARLLEAGLANGFVDDGRVPGHRLVERIGEGGMAVVYLAEQTGVLRREVAVKVMKPGMDSTEVLARFRAEQQVLGLMDHPGIAQVFEAGMTTTGHPYFAMELLDGPSLTDWCRCSGASIRERLKLFVSVCRAVQHAHLKGVLHRDLKPTNVLMKQGEGIVVPKVIDFGIAKALAGPDGWHRGEDRQWTQPGHAVGTPTYMSPEQAEGRRDLDLRSDVYALGVLLYELLAGVPPFRLSEGGTTVLLREICERQPARPSEFLRSGADAASAREIRGDLDSIILKALEKDRERRYASAAELADDVERYLRHEPVAARAPSTTYLLGRTLRRHWIPAMAAGLVWVSVIAALGVSVWQTRVARSERNAARLAQEEAEKARTRAERISEVLIEMVDSPDRTRDGREVRVIDVVDRAEARATEQLGDDPEALAEIRYALAGTHHNLGNHAAAERMYRQVLEHFEATLGRSHARVVECMSLLGKLVFAAGRTEEGLRWMFEALARSQGDGEEDRLQRLWAMVQYSASLLGVGRATEAERVMIEALPLTEGLTGEEVQARGTLFHNLAMVRGDRGDRAGQRGYLTQAIAVLETIPEARVDLATAFHNLGMSLREDGKLVEAEGWMVRSLELRERVLGTNHSHVGVSKAALATLRMDRGDLVAAEALAREALAIGTRVLPPRHRELYGMLMARGSTLMKLGRAQEALPFLEELGRVCAETDEPGSTRSAAADLLLEGALVEVGELERGALLIRRGYGILERTHPADHPLMRQASIWMKRLPR